MENILGNAVASIWIEFMPAQAGINSDNRYDFKSNCHYTTKKMDIGNKSKLGIMTCSVTPAIDTWRDKNVNHVKECAQYKKS